MDTGLEGKTVLITGGSSGIGKATALMFAEETEAQVAITYYQNEEGAKEIVEAIENNGGQALAVPMMLEDHAGIQKTVAETADRFGSIDVLVNNAVFWGDRKNRGKSFEEMPLSQWEETIGVNLFGMVKVTQEVVPFMRKTQWGRIINVSSDVALHSMKGSGPYGSLKSALFGFTANLVEELSEDGVLSNVVIPSWTLTERAINYFPEEFRQQAIKAFPANRVTLPEDVASMIVYLGSAANGHVNGEQICVTGKGSQAMLGSMFREFSEKNSKKSI